MPTLPRPANRLDRRVRTKWWTESAVVALIATVALWVASVPTRSSPALPAVVTPLLVAVAVVGPHLSYRRWRYEVRERDLFLSKGFLFFRTTLIPFDRIQYVENHQGPVDRIFGLTQLAAYTAGGRAGRIPGLDIPEAERVREELSRVAGTISV